MQFDNRAVIFALIIVAVAALTSVAFSDKCYTGKDIDSILAARLQGGDHE